MRKQMLKYTLKRLLGALFSLFVIVTVIFILLRFMPIEGFLGANYDKLSADTVQSLLNEKGLLDPIPVFTAICSTVIWANHGYTVPVIRLQIF